MHRRYHRWLTHEALQSRFGRPALRAILRANLAQDCLPGQMGHPEFHFDDSAIAAGNAYMERQRQAILQALAQARPAPAWQALGRLLHAGQDFYAHTNYVGLWVEKRRAVGLTWAADEIDPLDPDVLAHPALASGRNYLGIEIMALLPGLRDLLTRRSPLDSHLRLNLDGPEQGPLFGQALAAAARRTCQEVERLEAALSAHQRAVWYNFDETP